MSGLHRYHPSDLDLLTHLKPMSWLSVAQLGRVAGRLSSTSFKKHDVILHEGELASQFHILLAGAASVTHLNAEGARVMVALLAPGPVPDFPFPLNNPYHFQFEAFSDCRLGSLSWEQFDGITLNAGRSAERALNQNKLQRWFQVLVRGSSFLNLSLHERIALTLVELGSEFGVEDSRGTLLTVALSHKDLSQLVGASRPRVSEHLAELEREHLISRKDRQLIVHVSQLESFMKARAR
jgi:CRP-like cAMP-binding protein